MPEYLELCVFYGIIWSSISMACYLGYMGHCSPTLFLISYLHRCILHEAIELLTLVQGRHSSMCKKGQFFSINSTLWEDLD